MKIIRTNSENIDFMSLVKELDKDLAIRDGEDHVFYAQFNKLDHINHVIVLYIDEQAIGCGGIKHFDEESAEVKRMWVVPSHRGQGLAGKILRELEVWAKELGYEKTILETGVKQFEALRLYPKAGYHIIENYGPYVGVGNSVCFEKTIG